MRAAGQRYAIYPRTDYSLAIPCRHVGLIKIQGKEFEFEPIRLRSVRPFIFEDIALAPYHDKQTDDRKKLTSKVSVNKYLKSKVRPSIDCAGFRSRGDRPCLRFLPLKPCSRRTGQRAHRACESGVGRAAPGRRRFGALVAPDPLAGKSLSFAPRPPLRLSLTNSSAYVQVDYSGGPDGNGYFEVGNPQRFGQDFVDKVANPRDVVQFHRKSATRKAKVTMNEPDLKSLDAALLEATETGDNSGLEKVTVTSLVHEYLEAQNLNVLSESLIQSAVDEFVGKGDKDAVGK